MIFCLLAVPTFSFAETKAEPEAIIVPIGASFETSSDWNTEDNNAGIGGPILRGPAGSYVTSKVISSYTEKNKFIGYNSNTPDWSKASGYTLYTGNTYSFSASLKTKWGAASVKGTYKVGGANIKFKANPKRASRLAANSDVKVSKIQYKKWTNGRVIKTWTGLSAKPIGPKTNYVKYK